MKVLHYIPDAKAVAGTYISDYCAGVVSCMARQVDVHVLTLTADVHIENATVHVWRLGLMPFYTGRKRLRRILSDLRPDIVHINSCWSFYAGILSSECVKMRIPTIITPARRLEPWHFSHRYLLSKLPKYLLFQRKMVVRAAVVHAVCLQEAADLAMLCWHPKFKARRSLNDRVVLTNIFCSPVNSGAPRIADELLRLYRKVADSAPFPMMSAGELLVEDSLIMAGVADCGLHPGIPDNVLSLTQTFDGNAWRRILLHSADQGVLDIVRRGISITGVAVPSLSVDKVDRFAGGFTIRRKVRKRLPGSSKILRLQSDGSMSGKELDICVIFLTVMIKAQAAYVSRAELVELCRALRLGGYDEDTVEAKVRALGLLGDAAGLFQILKERYGLGEGFMFTEPSDGKAAAKFRVKLSKSDIQ